MGLIKSNNDGHGAIVFSGSRFKSPRYPVKTALTFVEVLGDVLSYIVDKGEREYLAFVGDARGVDAAVRNEVEPIEFRAYWNQLGKYAGHERNRRMVQLSDAAIAYPDAQSIGTIDLIEQALNDGQCVLIMPQEPLNVSIVNKNKRK